MNIDVLFLSHEVEPDVVKGRTAVVIDVLRATTTIATALFQGAEAVYPVAGVDEARQLSAQYPVAVLGGERGGLPPEGFHAGNSPLEYTKEKVTGRPVVLTTTNGTKALRRTIDAGAEAVATGALVNADAVAQWAMGRATDLTIVCAGTEEKFGLEDAVGAGCIVAACIRKGATASLTDSAFVALTLWERYQDRPADVFKDSFHGRRLEKLGFAHDLAYCAEVDSVPVVPLWRGGRLVAL